MSRPVPGYFSRMGLMDLLTGGGDDNDHRRDYNDFVDRYERGRPHEGYDDDEVYQRYQQVDGDLNDDDFEYSARESFQRMDPDERRQFARQLRSQARERGYSDFDDDDDRYQDPNALAGLLGGMRRQDPGLLGGLLGGGMGGGGMGGMMGGGGMGGGMMGNPLAKMAMAGIAASAARRMMGR